MPYESSAERATLGWVIDHRGRKARSVTSCVPRLTMPTGAGLRPRQRANGFLAISSADSSAGLYSWGDATARGARRSLCPRLSCLTPLAYGMRDGHGAFSGGAGKNSRLNLPTLAPRRDAAICHCSRTGGERFLVSRAVRNSANMAASSTSSQFRWFRNRISQRKSQQRVTGSKSVRTVSYDAQIN